MCTPASASAGRTSVRKQRACSLDSSRAVRVMSCSCSRVPSPSALRVPRPICWRRRRPATRTMKNSSRLLAKMARNLARSSSAPRGVAGEREHAPVEVEPADLAVEEPVGRQPVRRGDGRDGRRGDRLEAARAARLGAREGSVAGPCRSAVTRPWCATQVDGRPTAGAAAACPPGSRRSPRRPARASRTRWPGRSRSTSRPHGRRRGRPARCRRRAAPGPSRVASSYAATVPWTSLPGSRRSPRLQQPLGHPRGARADAEPEGLVQVGRGVDVAAQRVGRGQLARAGRAVPVARAGPEGGRERRAVGGEQRRARAPRRRATSARPRTGRARRARCVGPQRRQVGRERDDASAEVAPPQQGLAVRDGGVEPGGRPVRARPRRRAGPAPAPRAGRRSRRARARTAGQPRTASTTSHANARASSARPASPYAASRVLARDSSLRGSTTPQAAAGASSTGTRPSSRSPRRRGAPRGCSTAGRATRETPRRSGTTDEGERVRRRVGLRQRGPERRPGADGQHRAPHGGPRDARRRPRHRLVGHDLRQGARRRGHRRRAVVPARGAGPHGPRDPREPRLPAGRRCCPTGSPR